MADRWSNTQPLHFVEQRRTLRSKSCGCSADPTLPFRGALTFAGVPLLHETIRATVHREPSKAAMCCFTPRLRPRGLLARTGRVDERHTSDSVPINDGPKGEEHFSQPHPLLVTFDQNFKPLEIPALRGSAEGQVAFVGKTVDRSNRRLFLVDALCEFGWYKFGAVLKVINQTV